MYVVENGFCAYDKVEEDGPINDDYRINYLRSHIKEMIASVEEDGVDLLGYEMWSPIDIVSAPTGEMDKLYGFVLVNKNSAGEGDMSRSRKKNFYLYKKVIETNGADPDQVMNRIRRWARPEDAPDQGMGAAGG